MADYEDAQNQGKSQNKIPGQLVIKVHYKADDGSGEMTYSFKSNNLLVKTRRYLYEVAVGVYHDIEDPVIILPGTEELYITKVSTHEILYDEYGEVLEEYLLEEFGL